MTATNVILKRDRAILMTDGVMYTAQGLVVGFGQKAIAIPLLKAAIAVRGCQKIAGLLAMEMSIEFDSLDRFAAVGREYLGNKLADITSDLPDGLTSFCVMIAGWSDEQNRAIGFEFEKNPEGENFEEIDEWSIAPAPSDEENDILERLGCDLQEPSLASRFDPIRHGVPIMEAQRRTKCELWDLPGHDALHIVGGHVLATEVTRDGVAQRVLHRWHDEIGENIRPAPFDPTAVRPAASGLSRADRRRLEKLQRQRVA